MENLTFFKLFNLSLNQLYKLIQTKLVQIKLGSLNNMNISNCYFSKNYFTANKKSLEAKICDPL